MNKPIRLYSPHRFARLIAWAQAMLAWAALVLFSAVAPINRRHIRQRYHALSLDCVERVVRRLAMLRAAEIAHLRTGPRRLPRNAAPDGFRRRTTPEALRRAIAGSRFRKALKHRDIAERWRRLSAALADIDAFARRYLVPRAMRRLTRLFPVLMDAPAAEPLVSLALSPASAIDSS